MTAASFPIVAGAITYDDLKAAAGRPRTGDGLPERATETFVSPARRDDGWSTDPDSLPEGTRLRLNPSLNLAKLKMPPLTRMIALAAQRYGIVIRDQAGVMSFIQQDPTGDSAFLALGPKLTGGLYASQLLASFPWSHLQIMKMDRPSRLVAETRPKVTGRPCVGPRLSPASLARRQFWPRPHEEDRCQRRH